MTKDISKAGMRPLSPEEFMREETHERESRQATILDTTAKGEIFGVARELYGGDRECFPEW